MDQLVVLLAAGCGCGIWNPTIHPIARRHRGLVKKVEIRVTPAVLAGPPTTISTVGRNLSSVQILEAERDVP